MTTKAKIRKVLNDVFGERITFLHESTVIKEEGWVIHPVFFKLAFYSDRDHMKLHSNLASRGLALFGFSFSALRDAKVRVSLKVI